MAALSTPKSPERLAFIHFLRTGLRVPEHLFVVAVPLEAKFNPYHDPTNGQFTFGPGGGGVGAGTSVPADPRGVMPSLADGNGVSPGGLSDGVYRPADGAPSLLLTGAGPRTPRSYGSNYGAFLDPMTLEEAIPGLRGMPGGSILAIGNSVFDVTGPANNMLRAMYTDRYNMLRNEIKKIDPGYHRDVLPTRDEFQPSIGDINALRWDLAVAKYRVQRNSGPMQVETLRYLQESTNAGYDQAMALAKEGRLPPAPARQMAIGNYIDKYVRTAIKEQLFDRQIETGRGQPIGVNNRQYDSSGTDLTYTRPDVRVDDVALDVTIAAKTIRDPQIRSFFNADFKPRIVVIVRPQQLGPGSTYVISRPRK